jgi:hypothetical protein
VRRQAVDVQRNLSCAGVGLAGLRFHHDDDDPFDRNGVLKDGKRVRFGMMMRDGMTPLQRSIAEEATRASLHDGHGGTALIGHRPGFVTSEDSWRIRDQAYQQSRRDLADAWRTPTVPPVRSDAAPLDPRQPISMADAQAIRDAAYLEMCQELANAWRPA